MTYHEHLIARAQRRWRTGQHLPMNLFLEMVSAGLDADALERQHFKTPGEHDDDRDTEATAA